MADLRQAALRDEALISSITKGLDLNKPNDIKKVYSILASGEINFESKVGRDFDDHIYDLMEKVKSGEITDPDDKTKKTKKASKKASKKIDAKNDPKAGSKKEKTRGQKEEAVKPDDKEIKLLVELELKKRARKRRFLIIIASVVAVASLGYFGVYYYQNYKTGTDYESLASLKGSRSLASTSVGSDDGVTVHKTDPSSPDILPEYQTLFNKNKKFIGWLTIPGTTIDYPVMQTSDNEYYLTHNFDQEKDNNGSLFLDCSCSLYPRSTNMIIYGHHMKSGSMFGNLNKYASEDYYKKHTTIEFDTLYEYAQYEVMYVFYSKVYDNDEMVFKYYQFIEANSETEFDYYMSEMEKIALYDTGVTAHYGDTLLTLSTCDYSQADGRFAVVAKRIN